MHNRLVVPRSRLVAVAVAAMLLLAGCGIPDDSAVMALGPGPADGPAIGESGTAALPPTRDSATDKAQFVDYYLQAAAGDPDGAVGRVQAFLAPPLRVGFKPGSAVGTKIVRLVEKPLVNSGSADITLTVRQIGTLQTNGVLDPAPEQTSTKYVLTVGSVPGESGFYVVGAPPNVLLLTDSSLDTYYQRHTIYFWNTENTGLVPDLRYMPKSVPSVQWPTTILNWLATGPAPWLREVVQALPPNTTAPDNVPASTDEKLQISLSAQAVPEGDLGALDRLRRQLLWSLRPLMPRALEIKIGHQDPVSYSSTGYLASNAANRLVDTPQRFAISAGQIRRIAQSPQSADPVPVLKPEANRDVRSAAISENGAHTFAAIVTGSGATAALRVGVATTGSVADVVPVAGLAGSLGSPAWAITSAGDSAAAIGLITAGGHVYSFTADGRPAVPVEWQGAPGLVSSLSVAPDGHRVALVCAGRLYRSVLTTSGGGISLSGAEQILPPIVQTVAEVAWSSEGWLVVAGIRPDSRFTIMDVTTDGALDNMRLDDIGTEPVTYLSAYPANPASSQEWATSESYVAHGDSWDVSGAAIKINAADLYGAKPGDPKNSDPRNAPSAPFFLG